MKHLGQTIQTRDHRLARVVGVGANGELRLQPLVSNSERTAVTAQDKEAFSYTPEEGEELRTENLPMVETRAAKGMQTRDGQFFGYAAVFNSRSNEMWGFTEIIDPGAFEGRMGDDVRALINHDPNLLLGRSTTGSLRMSIDETGLKYEVDDPDTSYSQDLRKLMARGDVSQSSFAFTVSEDRWDHNHETGEVTRTILKVRQLYDVSPVTYPAYSAATSGFNERTEAEEGKTSEEEVHVEEVGMRAGVAMARVALMNMNTNSKF